LSRLSKTSMTFCGRSDYAEQTSWMLFLKYLDDLEEANAHKAELHGKKYERKEIQYNFPIRTGETAYLFLQHFIKSLKAGGRAAMAIKNTFLSNTDTASIALRKELLESCNLHTVLDMPGGTFQGAGVKTVVLFFEKGAPTGKIWFYKLNTGRNLGKTDPLNDDDLNDFVALQAQFKDSENSWTVQVNSIDQMTFDLSVKNPNRADETELRGPKEILAEMTALDAESATILKNEGRLEANYSGRSRHSQRRRHAFNRKSSLLEWRYSLGIAQRHEVVGSGRLNRQDHCRSA